MDANERIEPQNPWNCVFCMLSDEGFHCLTQVCIKRCQFPSLSHLCSYFIGFGVTDFRSQLMKLLPKWSDFFSKTHLIPGRPGWSAEIPRRIPTSSKWKNFLFFLLLMSSSSFSPVSKRIRGRKGGMNKRRTFFFPHEREKKKGQEQQWNPLSKGSLEGQIEKSFVGPSDLFLWERNHGGSTLKMIRKPTLDLASTFNVQKHNKVRSGSNFGHKKWPWLRPESVSQFDKASCRNRAFSMLDGQNYFLELPYFPLWKPKWLLFSPFLLLFFDNGLLSWSIPSSFPLPGQLTEEKKRSQKGSSQVEPRG